MTYPKGLTPEEQAAWARLADSVTPLFGRTRPTLAKPPEESPAQASGKSVKTTTKSRAAPAKKPAGKPASARPAGSMARSRTIGPDRAGLDSHWERRFKSGRVEPDLTLDLHGHTLDTAYARINAGLDQARAMGARVVLVIAGRERPVDPADRGARRGAVRRRRTCWGGSDCGATAAAERARGAGCARAPGRAVSSQDERGAR